MKDFRAVAQGLTEATRPHGLDHEFLNIDVVIRVLPAVQDVHHGQGHGIARIG